MFTSASEGLGSASGVAWFLVVSSEIERLWRSRPRELGPVSSLVSDMRVVSQEELCSETEYGC